MANQDREKQRYEDDQSQDQQMGKKTDEDES